jgi:dTDP-4-dehydrorhamnose 3,5-epimerase
MEGSLFGRDLAGIRSRYELAGEITPDVPADTPTVDASGQRLTTEIEGVVYSYVFTINPGRIKGWGMHRKQADRHFVCRGDIRVVLYDGRVKSPTREKFAQFHFSEGSPGRLLIPPGVWHADQNSGETEAILMNFPTRPFNREQPDKYRIDPESNEIPFDFRLRDG